MLQGISTYPYGPTMDRLYALEIELRKNRNPNVVGTNDEIMVLVVSRGKGVHKAVWIGDDVLKAGRMSGKRALKHFRELGLHYTTVA